nr:hypothetical protein NPLVJFJD_NPLVJFJD_CDS_0010 [Microvirus sp.]
MEIVAIFAALLTAVLGVYSATQARNANKESVEATNAANKAMQDSANATNIQIAESANAAQAAENEKAYERSKAGNQVNLLQQAGMSRAGAINVLNGGGSYTPAPINTAQVQASHNQAYQRDPNDIQNALSGIAGAFSNAGQMNQERKMQERSLQVQQEMQDKQLAADREKWLAENRRADAAAAREEYDHQLSKLNTEMRNAATAVSAMANPADYDTPAAYRKALYMKAKPEQRKYFDNADFTNALDLYHAVNVAAKNTAARTSNVQASTSSIVSATEIAKVTSVLQEQKHRKEMQVLQQQFDHNSTMYKLLEIKTQDEINAIATRLQYDSSEHAMKMARDSLELRFGVPLEQARDELRRAYENNSAFTVGSAERSYEKAYNTYVEQAQAILDKLTEIEE